LVAVSFVHLLPYVSGPEAELRWALGRTLMRSLRERDPDDERLRGAAQ
jgi:hypothetical protein